jgi:hypothetical protein
MMKTLLSLLGCLLVSFGLQAQQPVIKFEFNNSLTSTNNAVTLNCASPDYGPARTGTTGSSYFFNGNFSSVATASIPAIPTGTASRSISFWINFNAQFGPGLINIMGIGNGSINDAGYSLGILGGGNPAFYADNGQFVFANAPITNYEGNVWNHFTVTNGPAGFIVYQNGVQISAIPQAVVNLLGTNFFLGISNDNSTGNSFYLDDLAIYNTQLTAQQVLQIASDAAAPTISVNVDPVADTYAMALCTVDANASATSILVEYGTTTNFGSSIQVEDLVTGTAPQFISVPLTNLLPNTTYFIRATAQNAVGAAISNTFSFVTSDFIQDAPIIQNAQITATSATSFTVGFEVNPRGTQTTVEIRFTSCPVDPAQIIGIAPTTLTIPAGQGFQTGSIEVTGLGPNTEYAYSVRAVNSISSTSTAYQCTTTDSMLSITNNTITAVTPNSATLALGTLCNSFTVSYNISVYVDAGTYSQDTATLVFSFPGAIYDTLNNVSIPNLFPATLYTYRVVLESSIGETLTVDGTFTTANDPTALAPIHEFKFDNSHLDTLGDYGFQTGSVNASSFATDRFGNALSALKLVPGSSVDATPPASRPLPQTDSPRTISFWANYLTILGENNIFGYGTAVANQGFGLQENGNLVNVYLWGSSLNNTANPGNIVSNTWYHYVLTYGAGQIKLYRNNVLILTANRSINTQGSTMRLGRLLNEGAFTAGTVNALIDDLKIYDVALTAAQVSELFTNNNLSTGELIKPKNVVNVYPNPTKGLVEVATELDLERVQVYQMNGQLVFESKQAKFDVSSLPSNVYVLKIIHKSGEVSTQKLIKS